MPGAALTGTGLTGATAGLAAFGAFAVRGAALEVGISIDCPMVSLSGSVRRFHSASFSTETRLQWAMPVSVSPLRTMYVFGPSATGGGFGVVTGFGVAGFACGAGFGGSTGFVSVAGLAMVTVAVGFVVISPADALSARLGAPERRGVGCWWSFSFWCFLFLFLVLFSCRLAT